MSWTKWTVTKFEQKKQSFKSKIWVTQDIDMCKTCHITFTMALKCGLLNEYLVIVMEIRMNKLVILYSKNKQKIKKHLFCLSLTHWASAIQDFFSMLSWCWAQKCKKLIFIDVQKISGKTPELHFRQQIANYAVLANCWSFLVFSSNLSNF